MCVRGAISRTDDRVGVTAGEYEMSLLRAIRSSLAVPVGVSCRQEAWFFIVSCTEQWTLSWIDWNGTVEVVMAGRAYSSRPLQRHR